MTALNSKIPEVDETTCIGCALCAEIAPGTFAMDRERIALVFNANGDPEEKIQEAIDDCPVAAIFWQD